MKDDMLREWVAINLDIHLAVPRQQAVGRPVSGQDAAHSTHWHGVAPNSFREWHWRDDLGGERLYWNRRFRPGLSLPGCTGIGDGQASRN
jgi:hypothetical protein